MSKWKQEKYFLYQSKIGNDICTMDKGKRNVLYHCLRQNRTGYLSHRQMETAYGILYHKERRSNIFPIFYFFMFLSLENYRFSVFFFSYRGGASIHFWSCSPMVSSFRTLLFHICPSVYNTLNFLHTFLVIRANRSWSNLSILLQRVSSTRYFRLQNYHLLDLSFFFDPSLQKDRRR